MNELIESVVASLKEEKVYQDYLEKKAALDQHASLLWNYKQTKEEYIKMRPYFKYQDFTELKARFEDLSNQVSQLKAYQEYIKASHTLQDRLDELTDMIFKGVLENVEENVCVSSQESTNEEI